MKAPSIHMYTVYIDLQLDSHNIYLDLDEKPIVGTKSKMHYIRYVRILDKSKATCANRLAGLMEGKDLGFGHNRVVLRLIRIPWMHHAQLDASLEWPIQMEIILRLHQMHMQTEHMRLTWLDIETGTELVAIRGCVAFMGIYLIVGIGPQTFDQCANLFNLPDNGAIAVTSIDRLLLTTQLLVEILNAGLLLPGALLQHHNTLVHGLHDLFVHAVRILCRRRRQCTTLVTILLSTGAGARAGLMRLPSGNCCLLKSLQHELHVMWHICLQMLLQLIGLWPTDKIALDTCKRTFLLQLLLLLLPAIRAAGQVAMKLNG